MSERDTAHGMRLARRIAQKGADMCGVPLSVFLGAGASADILRRRRVACAFAKGLTRLRHVEIAQVFRCCRSMVAVSVAQVLAGIAENNVMRREWNEFALEFGVDPPLTKPKKRKAWKRRETPRPAVEDAFARSSARYEDDPRSMVAEPFWTAARCARQATPVSKDARR